jgi:hypothetical protein
MPRGRFAPRTPRGYLGRIEGAFRFDGVIPLS